ncbi:MAG: hypothetical protein CL666_13980 [Balneola sp.]|nr:hypothetical protein [Balneola sp.]|tara:strand:- start:47945 stop:49255 length:1311 start_codon:yes stop_codon:yes gene_type:complete
MKVNLSALFKKISKSKLVKDSASYTTLNVIEKAIPFLILPIVTRVLTKEEVGIYILYQAIVEVLIPVMTLNIDATVLLNYYKEKGEKFKEYFSNAILFFVALAILVSVGIWVFSEPISGLINFPSSWLIVICIIVISRFFTQLRQHLWRVNYEIKNYAFFTIGISIAKNLVGLVLILYLSIAWEGLIIGHLVGYSLFAVIALYTFKSDELYKFKLNHKFLKDAFHVGYPLALHKLGLWLGNAANRIIIAGILGTAATGSYGIGATFAIIVTVVEDAFNKAFVPHLFDKLKNLQEGNKSEIVKLSYIVYFVLTLLAFAVFLLGYFGVGFIFGEEYLSTRQFMLPLILAAMVKGYYKLHVNYIMFTKKTLKITQITLSTGVLNLILAYYMTVYFGIVGTAYSLLIINFLQYVLTFYVGNKLQPMPWLGTFKGFLIYGK